MEGIRAESNFTHSVIPVLDLADGLQHGFRPAPE
jgi:hypothetical protein